LAIDHVGDPVTAERTAQKGRPQCEDLTDDGRSPVAVLPESARELITSGALAHCATVNADGTPQLSVVWVGIDEHEADELVMAHLGAWQKVKNLRRDPRMALSFQAGTRSPEGMQHTLVLHGRARITEGGAPELLQRLARTYVAPDAVFPPFDNPPPGYVVHLKVERVGGLGPWNPPR
jgi:PPOX class probable F420-dependent enzyme